MVFTNGWDWMRFAGGLHRVTYDALTSWEAI